MGGIGYRDRGDGDIVSYHESGTGRIPGEHDETRVRVIMDEEGSLLLRKLRGQESLEGFD